MVEAIHPVIDSARIQRNLNTVQRRVDAAADAAKRPAGAVTLVAVSKFHPPEAIRVAYAAGQRDFGENYVQELVAKARTLSDLPDLRWHFIGALQRNKVKDLVGIASTIHSVDRVALAETLARLSEQSPRVIDCFVQVNLHGELQKSGVSPSELDTVLDVVRCAPKLKAAGLMIIPPVHLAPAELTDAFRRLAALAKERGLTGLSMGMSDDLELAVAAGASVVRIGTAIFGQRPAAMAAG